MTRPAPAPLLAVLAALAVAGCGGGGAGEETSSEPVAPVEVLVVTPRPFTEEITLTGEVQALDDVTLTAEASGTVLQLVPLGTRVGEGAVVARIESAEAEAAVAEAEAGLRSAQAAAERTQDRYNRLAPLVQDTIVAPVEFEGAISERDRAAASVRQAEARLASARQRVDDTRVTAPVAGRVEEHFVERGEPVQRGEQVARVVSSDDLRVRAGVPEAYAGEVEEGAPVVVRLRGRDAGTRRGVIAFVGAAVNPTGQTFAIEVSLPSDTPLQAGQVVEIAVPLRQIDDALFVPRTAVVRDERGEAVFIVERAPDSLRTGRPSPGPDGRAEDGQAENGADGSRAGRGGRSLVAYRRPVRLGPGSGGLVVVSRGLQRDEEVVVLGQEDLTGGELVRVEGRYTRPEAASTPLGGAYEDEGLGGERRRVPPAAPGRDLPGYAPPERPAPRDGGGR